jgi:hypothetical protein
MREKTKSFNAVDEFQRNLGRFLIAAQCVLTRFVIDFAP